MSSLTIDRFRYLTLAGDQGVDLDLAVAGTGPAVVLLHGFKQTHYMWRPVAREDIARHTVIVLDLRVNGESAIPVERGPETYSTRTMARDVVAVAAALGHERFGLVGHDRGARVDVGVGAVLDHPHSVPEFVVRRRAQVVTRAEPHGRALQAVAALADALAGDPVGR